MSFISDLIGEALNPAIWIIVAVAMYLTRGRSGMVRVAASVAATVALEALLAPAGSLLLAGLFFSGLVALSISSTWVLIGKSATFEEAYPDDADDDR